MIYIQNYVLKNNNGKNVKVKAFFFLSYSNSNASYYVKKKKNRLIVHTAEKIKSDDSFHYDYDNWITDYQLIIPLCLHQIYLFLTFPYCNACPSTKWSTFVTIEWCLFQWDIPRLESAYICRNNWNPPNPVGSVN